MRWASSSGLFSWPRWGAPRSRNRCSIATAVPCEIPYAGDGRSVGDEMCPRVAVTGRERRPERATDEGRCWSGRRDSNPRPSPWQGVHDGAADQHTRVFSQVSPTIRLTAGDREYPDLPVSCGGDVVERHSARFDPTSHESGRTKQPRSRGSPMATDGARPETGPITLSAATSKVPVGIRGSV
jgi:hypothetical protein